VRGILVGEHPWPGFIAWVFCTLVDAREVFGPVDLHSALAVTRYFSAPFKAALQAL